MTQATEITLDLDKLVNVLHVGVRRASAFMVIGTNAASLPIESLALPTFLSHRFFPDPLPDALKTDLQTEFSKWVVSSALREVEQHFSAFLDRVNEMLNLVEMHGTRVSLPLAVRNKSFEVKNAADKFELLAQRLGMANEHAVSLRRLTWMRNVFGHRLGRVDRDYAREDGKFVVSWLGSQIELVGESESVVVPNEHVGPFKAPNEATMAQVRIVERSKVFALGELVALSPFELNEICMFYEIAGGQVVEAIKAHLRSKGILSDVAA